MRLEHDPNADAVYVYFGTKKYAYGKDLDTQRTVDYAADGTPVGVELLNVSAGVDLTGLPHAGEIIGMLDARGISACIVEARSGGGVGPEDTSEFLVLCGGRYLATRRSAVRTRNVVTIELPRPITGPANARVHILEEAVTA